MRARRPSSAGPAASMRADRRADSRGTPCNAKLPPRARSEKDPSSLPSQNEDGGMQVIFGRSPNLVYPPSGWSADQARALPLKRQLRRDYVFGYNGRCRQSLHFISDSECVYPVASLVVVMDIMGNKQRFFEGHSNNVLCVAWNERRRLCASGQQDTKGSAGPFVAVWAPDDCSRTISRLIHPNGSRSVSAVGFSSDGKTVVSFTTDDSFTFFVWRGFARWDGTSQSVPKSAGQTPESVAPLYSTTSGRLPTGSLVVLPEVGPSQCVQFFTLGEAPQGKSRGALCGHYCHWTVVVESAHKVSVTQKRGIFGNCTTPRSPTGITYANQVGSAWMVADNGHIYTITGNSATRCKRVTPANTDVQLGCIAALPDGQRWVAGGSDGAIYLGVSDPVLRLEERLVIGEGLSGQEAELFRSSTVPRFSSIAVRGDLLLLGTSNNALILVDIASREVLRILQVSHPASAWGMDFHPSLAILASVSEARDVRFWNVAERRPAIGKVLRTEAPAFSLAFGQPEGSLLALGCDRGILEIYEFPSLQPVYRDVLSKGGDRIGDMRFSADGAYLAAACWDQTIYLLRIASAPGRASVGRTETQWEVRLHKALTGNSSTPTNVLFSANGAYLKSNSKDGQLLCWSTHDGHRSKSNAAFRDTRWQAPWTLPMGWAAIGVWGDPSYDGTDVKSVCQAYPPDDGYMAMGDDQGRIKLLRFPSPFLDPPCQVCSGHAAFVTKVRFSCANVLATLGGDDTTLMLWSLERTAEDAKAPTRLVHPWTQINGPAEDPYGFIGAPSFAQQQPQQHAHFADELPTSLSQGPDRNAPPRMEDPEDPWSRVVAAAGGGSASREQGAGRQRAASATPGSRRPPQMQQNQREEPPGDRASDERQAGGGGRPVNPGGRATSSNQSQGVRDALWWG
mmetsp:Transcript_175393/g.562669  ORF Transcript_175393/g.562669 Transcript_175393/m.562669 type:complete len:907 (+) Transcript_175393:156-2876(+)